MYCFIFLGLKFHSLVTSLRSIIKLLSTEANLGLAKSKLYAGDEISSLVFLVRNHHANNVKLPALDERSWSNSKLSS